MSSPLAAAERTPDCARHGRTSRTIDSKYRLPLTGEPIPPSAETLEPWRLAKTVFMEVALHRAPRDRAVQDLLNRSMDVFDPQLGISLRQDLNDGSADGTKMTPAIGPVGGQLAGMPDFAPIAGCETLESGGNLGV